MDHRLMIDQVKEISINEVRSFMHLLESTNPAAYGRLFRMSSNFLVKHR